MADGLPLFNGAQLAFDTTLVFPFRADGLPWCQCVHVDGAALAQNKQRIDPEPSGNHGRARLVVLAAEIGGRWSKEARAFVSQLARVIEHDKQSITVGRPCLHVPLHAIALFLLDRRAAVGCDGKIPSSFAV